MRGRRTRISLPLNPGYGALLSVDAPAPTAHIRAMSPGRSTSKSAPAPAAKPAPAPTGAPRKGDHVFLVDGSSYIFRAYWQSMNQDPKYNRRSDGLPTGAVRMFCIMLWRILAEMKPEEKPTHLAIVFDKSEKTFRTEMYPEYKAHRPDPPDD